MKQSLFLFRKLYIFLLLIFFYSSIYGQINVIHIDNNAQPEGKEGIFYALPRTIIRIDVTIDKIENYKGPYSEYALRFLGLKNVVIANSVEYKINSIRITTAAEPDPDQYYFLELGNRSGSKIATELLTLSEAGLILGTIPEKKDTVAKTEKTTIAESPVISETDVFPEIFKYSADMNVFEKVDTIIRKVNIDTMTLERQFLKRTIVEKAPEQKAKDAADYITKIKDNRFNLVSGFQEVNYGKETLEYMDNQLKMLEKEYMKLFTGISQHKSLKFSYAYTPNPNQVNTEVPIFKFLKGKGLMDLDEPGGKIITIKVQRSGTTGSVAAYLKRTGDKSKDHGFFYRIPELARVIVKFSENLTEETQCLVSQLGIVTYLPSDKGKVQFYKETGGIKSLKVD
ncbi:MAG: DUF4831 family protein [Bacteroidetes bacterium]|nr:DUF4831 family protein [Bacteroidota bacterium]